MRRGQPVGRRSTRTPPGLIEPVLIGPRARMQAVAQQSELKIDGIAIEDVPHSHAAAARAVELGAQAARSTR